MKYGSGLRTDVVYTFADETTAPFATDLSLDDAPVDVLTDRRRRRVLACLRERDAPMALADLARDVAARASNASPADVSVDRARRVRIDLYHVHLPKLADAGLVAFDADERTVRPTELLATR